MPSCVWGFGRSMDIPPMVERQRCGEEEGQRILAVVWGKGCDGARWQAGRRDLSCDKHLGAGSCPSYSGCEGGGGARLGD